jgi:hypothetical protein
MRLPPIVFAAALAASAGAAEVTPAPQAFRQETARRFTAVDGLPDGPLQHLHLATDGSPRACTGGVWHEFRNGSWHPAPGSAAPAGPAFSFPSPDGGYERTAFATAEVIDFAAAGPQRLVATARDLLLLGEGRPAPTGWPAGNAVRQIAVSAAGEVCVASAGGLWRRTAEGWEPLQIADGRGRLWAAADVRGAAFDAHGQLWFATLAGVGCRTAAGWRFFEGRDGLPWNDFTCVAAGPDGDVWFGTHLGAIRWDGREFHYRQGPRWLPHDDVRRIVVDAAGTAWLATAGGLGAIERRPMTLQAKAEFYEEEIARHVKRTPYGFVAEARLRRPADKATADPEDSDNDGLWTAMYGAGECFAFGATGDPAARERATQAFEALRFLQQVTQGGSPAPPPGYPARTIRPVDWPDPNLRGEERDRAKQQEDALWKILAPRWPRSADGRWYWKSDTSSDELDGHYFFYPLYHDLVARPGAEQARVRDVVRALTDHLIARDFNLVDHDGTPTRWGVYAPATLNHDPRWWGERGLKSLSILSYLAVARHVTGDTRYDAVARTLIDRHGYAQNLMFPKVQYGPGSGNQSDDEMAFMCFYNLLRHSNDPALKELARASFYGYWLNEAAELNPFFNFTYAAVAAGQVMRNPWGEFSVAPRGAWHAEAMATLHGFSLDRLNWPHRNSHRLDLVPLRGVQSRDFSEPDEPGRGHRADGRVLPVENRHFNHWNTDPWTLDYGGNGGVLGAGTVFLLPYYLGLYHGFIARP